MILGMPVTGMMMLAGGAVLLVLTLFQVLAGMRVIKLGKKHRVVHRWTAFAILGARGDSRASRRGVRHGGAAGIGVKVRFMLVQE